ncbi:MAG: PDZ domain-containing protein [Candidatus Eremiobacteraeota bacterium]|nr:PDZ domain-containing protein [Candidatus Eremiobacteraeota bacterium]
MTAEGVNGFGVGGPSIGKLGRVQEVGIDDLRLTNLIADYSSQKVGALSAPFVAANLGGNLLRRFAVTFDYGNETMTLIPNADFSQADTYERSGLFLIKRSGNVVVVDSRPGTPAADAGIAKGDVIASVNGSSTSGMLLSQVRDAFVQPAGTVVTLVIAGKDGTQRTVKITLRDYV